MKRGGSLIFTTTLAAASLWLYYQAGQQGTPAPSSTRFPDLYITQAQWDQFGEQGGLERSLRAARLRQWPGDQGTQLLEPQLEIHSRNNNRLRVTASEGWIYADDRPILLRQKVVLERLRQKGYQRLLVKTERLEIDKSGNTASTDAPVTVRSGRWQLTALGLRADLNEHRAEFLHQVRGIHE